MLAVGTESSAKAKRRLKAEAFNRRNSMMPKGINGRGEWIRTTDLLVPKLAAFAISMSTKQIFFAKNFILSTKSTLVGGQLGG
jgi:hypothetical protein